MTKMMRLILILAPISGLTGCIIEPADSFDTLGSTSSALSANVNKVPSQLNNSTTFVKHRLPQRIHNRRHHSLHSSSD
ncbi:hypothetical protein ACFORL_00160 [Legionella dresdenensis]|uniref:Lipoprotein n=1 Tax=Legionella dresdenensis TaxID=450200 RepID=A0ABV8CB11_9GAMM